MESDRGSFFEQAFHRLNSDRTPYPWQRRLFLEMTDSKWPQVVPLPTGSGKTSVLQIWLLALAWSLREETGSIPRRLAWVVNRRVVVDQVTQEAEELKKRLYSDELGEVLARASSSGIPLALSTLRGQFADNGDWARDPSTPAIVIGTVDMIGSRLLFRGYRSGRYHRPVHAGLLGVDTLIVNDEAHLSPAFARLLMEINLRAPAESVPGNKSFRVMLLSATPGSNEAKPWESSLDEDLAASEKFRRLFNAPKSLALCESDGAAIQAKFFQLAAENPAPRTLVFIEQPEKAAEFADRLAREKANVELLTGTMRGLERDGLAESTNFRKFLDEDPPAEPAWLVATSAAEVGVNLTCERLISGLVEADRLIQRFGRLNRFGRGSGEAHVIYTTPKRPGEIETLKYLQSLGADISCRNIWEHQPLREACTELPLLARMENRLIETWAMTSYKDRELGCAVEPWLHGKQEGDPPEAELVWRADVAILAEWRIGNEQIEEIFERYPTRAHERLREPAKRIFEKLSDIAEQMGEEAARTNFIQIAKDGSAGIVPLNGIERPEDLYYSTLVLPDRLGKLARGMFRPRLWAEADGSLDAADNAPYEPARRRVLFKDGEWTSLPGGEVLPDIPDLSRYAKEQGYRAPLVVRNLDSDSLLVYFVKRGERTNQLADVLLEKHRSEVAEKARRMAECVGLKDLAEKFRRAGELHDNGKRRRVWQRAFGGDIDAPIAKSKLPVNTRLLDGYRHELGSLVDAEAGGEIDDLILHLIASHHAGARPFFQDRQLDRDAVTKSQSAALESARRFARLQEQYGPWGLAYLEAVFKCADGLVSAEEGGGASE